MYLAVPTVIHLSMVVVFEVDNDEQRSFANYD